MPDTIAQAIVNESLALRVSHPHASAADVLDLVMQGRQFRLVDFGEHMDGLKGHPLEAFDRSIDVHVSRIRTAIEDDPRRPRFLQTVRGAGYVFTP